MNAVLRFAILATLISTSIFPAGARQKTAQEKTPSKGDIEAATRLQVFLDRANFRPGKIDGHYGVFTWKAPALYRESRGDQPQPPPPQGKTKSAVARDVTGLDLASVDPVVIPYS